MTCRETLEKYLRDNTIAYRLQHHPTAYTAQAVAEKEHVPGKMVAKVVMVVTDGKMTMLVLPAPKRVDLALVQAALGAKDIRLAGEQEFGAIFPDCEVGAMPPFGNLYGLPVVVDRALALDEFIVLKAGTHTDSISLRYADFEQLVRPKIADLGLGAREAHSS